MRSNDSSYNEVMYASADIDDTKILSLLSKVPDFNKNGFFGYASTLISTHMAGYNNDLAF